MAACLPAPQTQTVDVPNPQTIGWYTQSCISCSMDWPLTIAKSLSQQCNQMICPSKTRVLLPKGRVGCFYIKQGCWMKLFVQLGKLRSSTGKGNMNEFQWGNLSFMTGMNGNNPFIRGIHKFSFVKFPLLNRFSSQIRSVGMCHLYVCHGDASTFSGNHEFNRSL